MLLLRKPWERTHLACSGCAKRYVSETKHARCVRSQGKVFIVSAALHILFLKINLRFEQMMAQLDGIAEVEIRLLVLVIRRPLRQPFAVRIASRRKVHPVTRYHLGQFMIGLCERTVTWIEI